MFYKEGLFIISLLLGASSLQAEEKTFYMVFSGETGAERAIALSHYNQIRFGAETMILSNSESPSESCELLYSIYNRIKLTEVELNGIKEFSIGQIMLRYDEKRGYVCLTADVSDEFKIGIFNVSGQLVQQGDLRSGQELSVEKMSSGVYVAIAVSKSSSKSIKFIIK